MRGYPDWFYQLGQGELFGVPTQLWLLGVAATRTLSEELLNVLARLRELKVASRTSSWSLPPRMDVAQIRERSDVLREMLDAGQIGIVGGMYDVASGAVEFHGEPGPAVGARVPVR